MIELALVTSLMLLVVPASVPLVDGAIGQVYEVNSDALAETGYC